MLLVIVVSKPGAAQNDQLGWSDTAELTLVFTGGNAEATTLGLRNALMGDWEQLAVRLCRDSEFVLVDSVEKGRPSEPPK